MVAGSEEQSVDKKLAKLAGMCGVDATLAIARSDGGLSDVLGGLGDATCLAANVRALSMLRPISEDDLGRMFSAFRAILFYGFDDSPGSRALLSRLTGGAIKSAIPMERGNRWYPSRRNFPRNAGRFAVFDSASTSPTRGDSPLSVRATMFSRAGRIRLCWHDFGAAIRTRF
jgi:hypothetical protein